MPSSYPIHPHVAYSVFTSGAYRATAHNAAFPQEPGSPDKLACWGGRKAALRCPVLFRVEVKMLLDEIASIPPVPQQPIRLIPQ